MLTHVLSSLVPPRAPALSRDERRDALVAATVPLVREHGVGVTTAQIASAAGVAEGTIFRAFDSKDELLHAAVARAFDLSHLERALADVDPDLPLEQRLEQAVGMVQAHLTGFVAADGPARRDRRASARLQPTPPRRTSSDGVPPSGCTTRCCG